MAKAKKTKTMSSKAMKKTKGGLIAAAKTLEGRQGEAPLSVDANLSSATSYDASMEVMRKR